MLVPFADRADLQSAANPQLERRIIDYISGNLHVTAGGVYSHRMLTQAIDVLGPDRVMFGQDDPYGGSAGQTGADSRGRFGGNGGAREFVDTAPISRRTRPSSPTSTLSDSWRAKQANARRTNH